MIPRCVFLLAGLCSLLTPAAHAKSASGETTVSPSPDGAGRRAWTQEEMARALDEDSPLKAWISRLESTVAQGSSAEFDAFLNADWLLDSITCPVADGGGSEVAAVQTAFVQGTRASWAHRSLAKDYLGHQFRFLRAHSLGGRPGLLFRSAGDNGQLNYCLFSVVSAPDGSLGADDLYVVGMGEWVSDTLRRGYLTLIESLAPRGESGRRARLYLEALPRITAMQVALAEKNYPRVLALSSLLPAEVLQDRQILLTRMEAAEKISLVERARVFAEWKSLHPNPEQLPLKWADYHLAAGQFQEARTILAQLNTRLGGDAYLMLRLGEIKMLATHQAAGRLLGGRPNPDPESPARAESGR